MGVADAANRCFDACLAQCGAVGRGRIDLLVGRIQDDVREAAVVVGYGGNAYQIDQDTALGTNFNPTTVMSTAVYPKGGSIGSIIERCFITQMHQRAIQPRRPAAFFPSPQPTRLSSVSIRKIAAVLAGTFNGNTDPPRLNACDPHDLLRLKPCKRPIQQRIGHHSRYLISGNRVSAVIFICWS